MAKNALRWLFSKPGATPADPRQLMNVGDIALRLGPDTGVAFANAMMTEGDLADKLIAGGTDFALSSLPGLAAGRITNSAAVDQLASLAGSYSALPIGNMAMRGKDRLMGGEGLTPYERLSIEQQEALRQQTIEQVMTAYGLLPGTRSQYYSDPSTGMGVA